ncbi:MAG TPA: helix-turn-helix transcriptional regulator [Patescibacteria group bacterium]|nr:helix-turn-helix transcriptional regulator [Patescibacteria group bacterium]
MIDTKKEQAQKELGLKLKEAREKAGLTQVEVASKTDMTDNYYAMIERGEVNPSFDKLRKLFKLLNIKLSEISL